MDVQYFIQKKILHVSCWMIFKRHKHKWKKVYFSIITWQNILEAAEERSSQESLKRRGAQGGTTPSHNERTQG